MNENRTEKPTKQKLKKAKAKGQVAKSTFLAGALVFVGGILLIWGLRSLFAQRFEESMRVAFSQLSEPSIEGAFQQVLAPLLFPVLLTLSGIVVIAAAAHLFQTGWIFSFEQIKPKWRKKGGERRIVLPLLQLAIIGGGGYFAAGIKMDPALLFSSPNEQVAYILKKLFVLAIEVGALLLFLGLCDLFYQKWRYYKKMHMTREEKKQEQKESEGDSQLKGRMHDNRD